MADAHTGDAERPVDGIVLAAGLSTRMGRPKPLLWIGGETFVERAIRVLERGGCRNVVVVVRPGLDRVAALARAAGARYVMNELENAEQVDSIRLGLRALPEDAAAAVILPVDQPLVNPTTVRAVIDAFAERSAPVVRPVHEGVAGHPTVISRALFDALFEDDLPHGAETVLERHQAEIEDVEVADAGATIDLNTAEQYARHIGREPGDVGDAARLPDGTAPDDSRGGTGGTGGAAEREGRAAPADGGTGEEGGATRG